MDLMSLFKRLQNDKRVANRGKYDGDRGKILMLISEPVGCGAPYRRRDVVVDSILFRRWSH